LWFWHIKVAPGSILFFSVMLPDYELAPKILLSSALSRRTITQCVCWWLVCFPGLRNQEEMMARHGIWVDSIPHFTVGHSACASAQSSLLSA